MTSENQRGPSRSMAVARKEFREIFRDRRTLMNVVISPLVVTPALFALMGGVINSTVAKIRNAAVRGGDGPGFRPDSPVSGGAPQGAESETGNGGGESGGGTEKFRISGSLPPLSRPPIWMRRSPRRVPRRLSFCWMQATRNRRRRAAL